MELITEFEFELPRGYLDENGELHKRGVMRMATAADEILPLRDPRVVSNPAYLTIILLSRVVTSLGTLQNMYQQINSMEELTETCVCPACGEKFKKPINFTRAE